MNIPTQAGYLSFIRNVMGINSTVLPDDSPSIVTSYCVSKELVDPVMQQISCEIYKLCVYNLAGDRLLNFAQDQDGQTFFAKARENFHINSFQAGVIQSSGDEGTNESMVVPEAFEHLTILDLQNLKTPYGRTYLSYAQQLGTLWGLT